MKISIKDRVRVLGLQDHLTFFQGEVVHIFKPFDMPDKRLVKKYYGENPPLSATRVSPYPRIVVQSDEGKFFVTPINTQGRNDFFEIVKLYVKPVAI